MVYIPSEDELESQRGDGFSLMGEDDYIVEVKELTIKPQPNPYNEGKLRDVAMVKLTVISFANGETLYDADGVDTSDRLFFDFLEIEKMGMKPQPSKARKFTAACLNQPISQSIELDSWQDLVGKRLVAHAIVKKNGKQGIDSYKPVRRGRPANAAAAAPVTLPGETLAAAPAAAVETTDIAAKAAEIFGDEASF